VNSAGLLDYRFLASFEMTGKVKVRVEGLGMTNGNDKELEMLGIFL